MRKVWWVLGIGVLSLPLLFVSWLLLAVQWPRMDSTTMRLPTEVQALVAGAVAQNASSWRKSDRAKLERVIRLDPANAVAWSGLCTGYFGEKERSADLKTCERAVSLMGSADDYSGLGDAQEDAGDSCAAEQSYSTAATKAASSMRYIYPQNMGQAALECGDLYSSRAGLETAIQLQTKELQDPDNDDDEEEIAGIKKDQAADNEYLVVVLDRLKDAKASQAACSAAHPQWKTCACAMNDAEDVVCHEAR